jgi:hypothetical protein
LHFEELHDLFVSSNIIRVDEIKEDEVGRACGMLGGKEKCIGGFGGEA